MTNLLVRVLLCAATLALPGAAQAAKSTKPKLMLMDLPPVEGIKPGSIKAMNEFLAGALRDQGFDVASSQDIAAVLGVERQKQLLGCAESSCLAEIGGALGAEFIVRGTVAPLGSKTALTLVILDNKGSALNQERELLKSSDEGDMVEGMERMVPALVKPVKASLGRAAGSASVGSPAAGGLESSKEAEGGTSGGKLAGYGLLGLGGAALLSSGIVGYFAYDKAKTAATDAIGVQGTQPVSERSTAVGAAWASTGLLAGGVVAAGVGAVLVLVSGPSKAEAAMTLSPAGGPALALNF